MNIKHFENILRMSQKHLKRYLANELKRRGRVVVKGDGYIYSPGKLPIILCAHLDTVHKEAPASILLSNGELSSPQGIGGDDRCGVWMIMEIIKKVNPTVIFFEDEESGGVGSNKFCKTELCDELIGKVNYVIELDRKGNRDAVFYDCDNPEFTKFITAEFWKEAYGSFTDICNICPVLGCAGVNLSCGYYLQHTKSEYIILAEMETAMKETIKLINRGTDVLYEYIEAEDPWKDYWKGYNYGYGGGIFSKYYNGVTKETAKVYEDEYTIIFINDEGFEEPYVTLAVSEEEAVGMFVMEHPNKCYMDIVEII